MSDDLRIMLEDADAAALAALANRLAAHAIRDIRGSFPERGKEPRMSPSDLLALV